MKSWRGKKQADKRVDPTLKKETSLDEGETGSPDASSDDELAVAPTSQESEAKVGEPSDHVSTSELETPLPETDQTTAAPVPDQAQNAISSATLSAKGNDFPRETSGRKKERSRFISRRFDDVMILAAVAAFATLAVAFGALRGSGDDQSVSEPKPVALLNASDQAYVAYQKGDFRTARTLWRGAAQQGDLNAQYNLGLIYAEGRGVVRNPEAAMEWWRQAAERGHVRAQHNLALALVSGETLTPGMWSPSDMGEAETLLRQAIASGYVAAEYSLGSLLLLKSENEDEARSLLRSASDKGHNPARFALASAYLKEKTFVGDKREALVLFIQAASSGYGQAQLELANLYVQGVEVQKNDTEALAWATLALKNHEQGASALRSKLLDTLSDEEVAIAHRRIVDLAKG